ncbi:MAG: PIG-L family deacetylase [Deinococcales bacterium]
MRLLAVFAHPDDELGCVGTLARHAARGDQVMLAWTTHGELASQFRGTPAEDVRRIRHEHGAFVAEAVGATSTFFDMGDSRMTGGRDEALALAALYARFRPDAVITWSDDSPHPDHRMTAKIAFDAITLARIPKIVAESGEELEAHRTPVRLYQYPTLGSGRPQVHVDISDQRDLIERLFRFYADFYHWQLGADDFLAARRSAGRESGVDLAERFELRRSVAPARAYLP